MISMMRCSRASTIKSSLQGTGEPLIQRAFGLAPAVRRADLVGRPLVDLLRRALEAARKVRFAVKIQAAQDTSPEFSRIFAELFVEEGCAAWVRCRELQQMCVDAVPKPDVALDRGPFGPMCRIVAAVGGFQ